MNKKDYQIGVDQLIEKGKYELLEKNPLPKMIEELKTALTACKSIISKDTKTSLTSSNPTIPKLYCLPKIHKPGNAMRPIVSNIGSPTYNLCKWLINEFNHLEVQQSSFSVKNS